MRFDNAEPSVPKMLVQHFKGAFSPSHVPMIGVPPDDSMTCPEAGEEDHDAYPLQFQDILNLEGFGSRLLALWECQN
jgi:hypothetical protein